MERDAEHVFLHMTSKSPKCSGGAKAFLLDYLFFLPYTGRHANGANTAAHKKDEH